MSRVGVLAGALVGAVIVTAGFVVVDRDEQQSAQVITTTAAEKPLSTSQLVGQRIVTGYVGTKPPGDVLRAVKLGHVGGVILFQNNIPTLNSARRSIKRLQQAAADGKQPELFVMIDQEGGLVKRLPTLPPRFSAARIGLADDVEAEARAEGAATGEALRELGFNTDLAPVADVPRVRGSFLGTRAFSKNAATVADAACAFSAGLEGAKVASAMKHFPGLGRAGGNTDFDKIRIDASTAAIKSDWTAYRQCSEVPSFVMISSATYPRLGIKVPASLSPTTFELLGDTGFTGLTITDAFETPAVKAQRNAARRALNAGMGVLLFGQAFGDATAAYNKLLRDARNGTLKRTELEAQAARVIDLKTKLSTGS